ncbi:cupredoxin domain-containing protein [Candidatus Nitronereus thalassa]|uniref:Cupredoxin domain-containing protein n=1 Tax=Candidatus Nitronereus thalassa TaxID=3020898 RepID=A0ABU3KB13_9BACT|nr:cupredoxin domain-containing protein [Candidatus Nitronereus thalassa]MDT7043582.1 cupredoxin domain-containing protein [Candidatus Nitronereus thalassa]
MSHLIKWGLSFSLFIFFGMANVAEAGNMNNSPVLINMENWAPYYRPYEAAVPSQVPIHWRNPTASPHTVRHDDCANAGPCLFDSGAVPPNESFTITGLKPGRYPYHCELHPIMRGELIVTDSGIEGPVEFAIISLNVKH